MDARIKLHNQLTKIVPKKQVYFDPPESAKLKYPCFIYSENNPTTFYSNNKPFFWKRSFNVIYIDPNPDSGIIDTMLREFSGIRPGRPYIADNLHHNPFDISI